MIAQEDHANLKVLLEGLRHDAARYFKKAAKVIEGKEIHEHVQPFELLAPREQAANRDRYWSLLPRSLQDEGKHLNARLTSLMGEVARAARSAPLASEGDQRDLSIGTKVMRSALLLRRFRWWSAEILHDEDVVLGVTPAGQSDDEALDASEAAHVFIGWAEKVQAILDLVTASSGLSSVTQIGEAARYRPGTAFILMWMDKSKPELVDVSDTVKSVFELFGIQAVRADDIEHEGLITPRILDEIKTAEFCYADLTGERPNVYYEVGYAHALGRRVILYRKAGTDLHFDLAGYNCPAYENLHDLKQQLTNRLRALTNKEPK